MIKDLSSTQKAVAGAVAIAGVVGWIFAYVQIGEIDTLENELGPARQDLASARDDLASARDDLASATDELAQIEGNLEAAQSERDQLQQQVEGAASLEELTVALAAGNAEMLSLQSEVEGLQAELKPLRAEVQRQQALLEGSVLRFRTTTRAKVRAGPGTNTDEVAVIPTGNTIQVFEIVEDGTWYKVGGMGYIFHELLEPVE